MASCVVVRDCMIGRSGKTTDSTDFTRISTDRSGKFAKIYWIDMRKKGRRGGDGLLIEIAMAITSPDSFSASV